MSVFANDIEKQIQQHQQKIQELEKLKVDQAKKFEGIKEFDVQIKRLCNQNSLSENELYVSRSEQIEEWIVGLSKSDNPSSIYNNLKKHFEKVVAREVRGKAGKSDKVSALPKPKLPIGLYQNPATHEKVEKIKRNPRQLDEWISEYGFEIVKTWKVV